MTFIEWLEYVLLNAIFPGPSDVCAFVTRSFVLNPPAVVLADRIWRLGVPRDEAEESVSSEFVPCSEFDSGIGGTVSPGESSPFFVVVGWLLDDRPPSANRPFAFGADATRRMKRDALAPNALGESGPPLREGVVGVGGMNESVDECAAVCGPLRPSMRCFSARFLERALSALAADSGSCACSCSCSCSAASAGWADQSGGVGGVVCTARVGIEGFESLERVLDELYDDRGPGDARRVGIEDAAEVRGVRAAPDEVWMVLVSRVREDAVTFLDDWLPILNIDFHAGVLLGDVGDNGWTGRGE